MLKYLNYNELNIEEILKIENCESAEIVLKPDEKNVYSF